MPFLLQVLEQFPFSFEFNSLLLEVTCRAFLINYFRCKETIRTFWGNCREKTVDYLQKYYVFPHWSGTFGKFCDVLEVSHAWRLLWGHRQSSQVDLLAKSEICSGAAVVCDAAGVIPLGLSGGMLPQEIWKMEVAKTCFPSFWAEMSCSALHEASTNQTMN